MTSSSTELAISERANRWPWAEFVVVVGIAYASSFLDQWLPHSIIIGGLAAPSQLASVLARLLALLFVVFLADGTFAKIGLRPLEWKSDIPAFIGLSFLMYLIHKAPTLLPSDLHNQLASGGLPSATDTELIAGATWVATIPGIFMSAIHQEIFFRGYLIGRLRKLTGVVWAPVLISTVMFGSWHLYQDSLGWIGATTVGLAFALVYVRTGRLWPLIFVHFMNNLWASWVVYEHLTHSGRSL
jgi:membrane protease YdiL (CAAX protease family)